MQNTETTKLQKAFLRTRSRAPEFFSYVPRRIIIAPHVVRFVDCEMNWGGIKAIDSVGDRLDFEIGRHLKRQQRQVVCYKPTTTSVVRGVPFRF